MLESILVSVLLGILSVIWGQSLALHQRAMLRAEKQMKQAIKVINCCRVFQDKADGFCDKRLLEGSDSQWLVHSGPKSCQVEWVVNGEHHVFTAHL